MPDYLPYVTCFGDSVFSAVCSPDAHRAMPPQGCGAQKHPGGAYGTAQGPEEFHVPCNATGSKVIVNDLNVTSRKNSLAERVPCLVQRITYTLALRLSS